MSIRALVEPQLPLLRRYARLLSGDQAIGDACVRATLASLIADPGVIGRMADPRVALYRLFTDHWNAGTAGDRSARPKETSTVERHLDALPPLPRQAFLLTAVEGFSPAKAALVLSLTPAEVLELIDQAGRAIAAQLSSSVLIIEDQPIIAMDLEALVTGLGHRVVGKARTRADAVAAAKAERPGLVLADIELADGSSGLDAVNDILEHIHVPVIFVTAYQEALLTGQKPEPTFLIPKPFREETVKAVVSQALFFGEAANRLARV